MLTERLGATTRDGWRLDLKRTWSAAHLRPGSRPVLIVPGYGMNAFIFGFHPRGTSLERCLAEQGLEVWSVNLRGQGGSCPLRRDAPGPSLRAHAEEDLEAALAAVLQHSRTGAERVDVIGCSLGGSLVYAHLALCPGHRVGALVAVGAPLRWVGVPRVVRLLASPQLVGALRLGGTRRLAAVGLRLAGRVPGLLSVYMNPRHVDLAAAGQLVQTVEDPAPGTTRDIAQWVRSGDLWLRGINITEAMRRVDRPLLLVVSNRDGIVPEAAALSAAQVWGGPNVQVLRVGDEQDWFAHADLFIADAAPERVFAPMARWLCAQGS
ncbi:MAG: alpha/beta fold hydrolase [Myxococcales bacterium]|nr:alpha/beta hydrolase [Myxococcota bacterium]MDW8281034.1 alpha/beta fold hydrolase [Myxococcales bacterium]